MNSPRGAVLALTHFAYTGHSPVRSGLAAGMSCTYQLRGLSLRSSLRSGSRMETLQHRAAGGVFISKPRLPEAQGSMTCGHMREQ